MVKNSTWKRFLFWKTRLIKSYSYGEPCVRRSFWSRNPSNWKAKLHNSVPPCVERCQEASSLTILRDLSLHLVGNSGVVPKTCWLFQGLDSFLCICNGFVFFASSAFSCKHYEHSFAVFLLCFINTMFQNTTVRQSLLAVYGMPGHVSILKAISFWVRLW